MSKFKNDPNPSMYSDWQSWANAYLVNKNRQELSSRFADDWYTNGDSLDLTYHWQNSWTHVGFGFQLPIIYRMKKYGIALLTGAIKRTINAPTSGQVIFNNIPAGWIPQTHTGPIVTTSFGPSFTPIVGTMTFSGLSHTTPNEIKYYGQSSTTVNYMAFNHIYAIGDLKDGI